MSNKKKQEIEFRYYELPEGEHVFPVIGENWRRVYGWEHPGLHFHNLMEIGICYEGEGILLFDEEEIPYKPGMITVIPQNFPHTTISKIDSLSFWEYLFIDPEKLLLSVFPEEQIYVDKLLAKINHKAVAWENDENTEFESILRVAIEECRNRQKYTHDVLEGLLMSLLMLVARNHPEEAVNRSQTSKAGIDQIINAIDYVDENYMEQLKMEELAQKCSLSETHFRRIFVEYMNMTPAEYVTLVRIRNACDLINKSRYSMTEIADRVGYPIISTFNRNFRKIVGTSPYHYKKNRDNYEGKLMNFKVTAKKGW